MRILEDAENKIKEYNETDSIFSSMDYHKVLLARGEDKSVVTPEGNVNKEFLEKLDAALRGYFQMNRGGSMGDSERFVQKLENRLAQDRSQEILASLRRATIVSPDLEDYREVSEDLYDSISSRDRGVSEGGKEFCVGATKVMHCLFPDLFVMLDIHVGVACGYPSGRYNNFTAYWRVMRICHLELDEWKQRHGSLDSLLRLDSSPFTSLTRIFDKCATISARHV